MSLEKIPREKTERERCLDLVGRKMPDAFVLLSGDISPKVPKNEKDRLEIESHEMLQDFGQRIYGDAAKVEGKHPEYRSTAPADEDPHGIYAEGTLRVAALAHLAKNLTEPKIVTTSRDIDRNSGRPLHSEVLQDDLARRQISADRIIHESESINTKTQIAEMLKLAYKEKWKKIVIVTSEYHIFRAREFYRAIMNYKENDLAKIKDDEKLCEAVDNLKDLEVRFLSDRRILTTISHKSWKKVFSHLGKTKGHFLSKFMNWQGATQLKEGTYGTKK